MITFYRGVFSQVWISLESNEALGVLDTDYVEDYNGVDGQVSLLHMASGQRFVVPMIAVPSETPGTPNDYFRGVFDLSSLPNGTFQVQGRVRDVLGNYSIIGAVSEPNGGERVLALPLQVLSGFSARYTVCAGPLTLRGALTVGKRVARRELRIELGD